MLTVQEIRNLGETEWKSEYKKVHEELVRLRLQIINGHSKATDKLRKLKRYIAKLLTIQQEQNSKTDK